MRTKRLKIFLNINRLLIAIMFVVVNFIFLSFFPAFSSIDVWSEKVSIYLLLLCILQLFSIKIFLHEKRLFIYLFVVLTYLFHFSHIFLNAIGYTFNFIGTSMYALRYESDTIVSSTFYSTKAIIGLYLGCILFLVFHRSILNTVELNSEFSKVYFSKTFKLVMISIGLIFDIGRNIRVYMATSNGYASVTKTSIPYVVLLLSYMLLPGALLFITDDELSPKRKRLIVIAFVAYKLFTMLGGARAYALLNIILVIYIHYRRNVEKKISLKSIIKFLAIFQIGGGFLVGIRNTRATGVRLFNVFRYVFDLRYNILFEMMSEFGITQNVICMELEEIKGIASGGKQLLYSFVSIVPGISFILNWDFESMCLDDSLNLHSYGGSYIADMIFDFGVDKILLASIVLGLIIAWLFEKYEESIFFQDPSFAIMVSPILVDVMFCVRSSLTKMPRMICWYLTMYLLINAFFKGRRIHRILLNNCGELAGIQELSK